MNCNTITAAPYFRSDNVQQRVRCIELADHRGPHWKNVEEVPDGCSCALVCRCFDLQDTTSDEGLHR